MEKKLDKRGRWRNKATSFMMSPEERADLDVRVSLSGLTKQEYMVRRLLERDVIVFHMVVLFLVILSFLLAYFYLLFY